MAKSHRNSGKGKLCSFSLNRTKSRRHCDPAESILPEAGVGEGSDENRHFKTTRPENQEPADGELLCYKGSLSSQAPGPPNTILPSQICVANIMLPSQTSPAPNIASVGPTEPSLDIRTSNHGDEQGLKTRSYSLSHVRGISTAGAGNTFWSFDEVQCEQPWTCQFCAPMSPWSWSMVSFFKQVTSATSALPCLLHCPWSLSLSKSLPSEFIVPLSPRNGFPLFEAPQGRSCLMSPEEKPFG